MTTTRTNPPRHIYDQLGALRAGTLLNIGTDGAVLLAGREVTGEHVLDLIDAYADLVREAKISREGLTAALAARREALPYMTLFVGNYEAFLKAKYGVDSPRLLDFGIAPVDVTRELDDAATRPRGTLAPPRGKGQLTLVVGGKDEPR